MNLVIFRFFFSFSIAIRS
ncbi:pheST operon leader peptide PheM [Gilliamella apicola]|uniref:pheST attenuator peptide n=1 Tax=Gilliamella apicola TaxID=1196095 RepID=A0A556RU54_9GAMM|nr:pheST operon leader peptide PheM [Gilliamella apicola]